jgi:ribosomal protein S18 acetylase RimI-like enzyme
MQVKRISVEDDLKTISKDINNTHWDEQNEMDDDGFGEEDIRAYLEQNGTIFLVCYDNGVFAGVASARVLLKPYGESWLYLDEIDVPVNMRKQGVGSLMMKELFEIAREKGCVEVWVGTEKDNKIAQSFYQSLQPTEVEEFIGYTFKL